MKRPREQRPKTELQLYRQGIVAAAVERREQMAKRLEANWEARHTRARELYDAALDRRERIVERLEKVREAAREGTIVAPTEIPRPVEIHDPARTGMWTGLAVGLGVTAVLGVAGVLVYLLVRKKDGQIVGVQAIQGLGRPSQPMLMGGGISGAGLSEEAVADVIASMQPAEKAPPAQPSIWNSSTMKSYTLPSLNDKTRGAIRVAQATDLPYDVMIRTIGPPGQYAALSLNVGELNSASGVPVGDLILLPTSQFQTLKLKPKEVLYAKGSQSNVIISVTANAATGG